MAANAAEEEARLMRMARKYQETEQSKSLRWFPAVGDDIPTDDDVAREALLREASLEAEAAARRDAERHTDVARFEKHAPVHADEHPAFSLPPEELAAQRPTTYAAAAAETVETKKHLHKTFTSGLWLMLARLRAERRLQRMAAAQRMRQATAQQAVKEADRANKGLSSAASRVTAKSDASGANDAATSRSTYKLDVDNIALLTLPALPPQGSTDAAPGTGGGGGGGLAATLAEEGPTTADAEVFLEKEFKVPFEFKQRHYTRFKFTEHHFATRDPEEAPPNFPAGPAEALEADADATVPALSNFTQPTVTLERFPGYEFAFERTMPHEGIVSGRDPQPVTDGGFLEPQYALDYGQAVPSACRPVDAVRSAIVTAPLPAPLKRPDDADDVSDDDDADDDVALPKPNSLTSIASNFLPAFGPPSGSRSATPGGEELGKRKASLVGAGGDAMLAFEERPINNTGRELLNRRAAETLAVAAESLKALAAHLPPNHRINF